MKKKYWKQPKRENLLIGKYFSPLGDKWTWTEEEDELIEWEGLSVKWRAGKAECGVSHITSVAITGFSSLCMRAQFLFCVFITVADLHDQQLSLWSHNMWPVILQIIKIKWGDTWVIWVGTRGKKINSRSASADLSSPLPAIICLASNRNCSMNDEWNRWMAFIMRKANILLRMAGWAVCMFICCSLFGHIHSSHKPEVNPHDPDFMTDVLPSYCFIPL